MLAQIKTQHREIARLSFEGFRPIEISEKTGMAISSVRAIISDPLCQAYIATLDDKADDGVITTRKRMANMVSKSLDVIDDMLSLEVPPNVALRAAHDILDRTGHQPVQRHEHVHGHLTREDLEELKARARKAKVMIVDAGPGSKASKEETVIAAEVINH